MRIFTLPLLFLSLPALAEHLPGGTITTRCISGVQHEVTLQLWRECTGAAMIAQDLTFRNECGVQFVLSNIPLISVENVSPVCPDQLDQTTCNGGPLTGIEMYTYRTTVPLSACNFWTISWSTCCRYPSVNINGSPGLYVEARLNNLGSACIESPVFTDPVPPFVCVGQPASFDLGLTAPPDLVPRYRFIAGRRQTNLNPVVVEAIAYLPPHSGAAPYTGMAIDSITGNITFTPDVQGYIIVVVEVNYTDANGIWRGSVMRDFPFVAQVCDNAVPDAASGLLGNAQGSGSITGDYAASTCGGSFCFEAIVTDADAGQVLTLNSNIDQVVEGATFNVSGSNPATASICIDASVLPLGTYTFTINAIDDACPVVGSQTYTYTLTVGDAGADAGEDAQASICPGQSIDLSTLLTGDPGGTWSAGPVVNAPGTYTYTIVTSCGSDEATFTITADTAPNAGSDAAVTICAGQVVDLNDYVNGDPGGTWSDGAPLVSTAGTYGYSVSNACGSAMAFFSVIVTVPVSAGIDNAISTCSQAQPILMLDSLLGNPASGGTWEGPMGAHGPVFDPAVDSEGVYCYTVFSPPPCPESVACITISLLPPSDPVCISLGLLERGTEVSLLPNPSHGTLRVEGMRVQHAAVLDAAGRIVWSSAQRILDGTITLPGALPNGSYAIQLRAADGQYVTQRFELVR